MDNAVRFFSGHNIKIEPGKMGVLINVTMPDGRFFEDAEPRRYFPISDIYRNISIVKNVIDDKGKENIEELLIIKDTAKLDPDSKDALLAALDKYYMIPKILDIYEQKTVFNIISWHVKTDRGDYQFELRDLYSSIKQLPNGRILVIDASDNRYEIDDYTKLSKKGQKLLLGYL